MDYLNLKGKKIIISGVANERSLAWGIAKELSAAGAQLAFLYAERMEKWVNKLTEPLEGCLRICFDGGDDDSITKAFDIIGSEWGTVDGMLHSIAFAPQEAIKQDFIECKREDFLLAQNISAYTLIAMSRCARELMPNGGSIVALSFIGSTRNMGQYHVMGAAKSSLECSMRYLASNLGENNIRINILSPGPVKTLSAKGVIDFAQLNTLYFGHCPLPIESIDSQDVADSACFLFSERSKKINGEVIFIDGGYHMMGTSI